MPGIAFITDQYQILNIMHESSCVIFFFLSSRLCGDCAILFFVAVFFLLLLAFGMNAMCIWFIAILSKKCKMCCLHFYVNDNDRKKGAKQSISHSGQYYTLAFFVCATIGVVIVASALNHHRRHLSHLNLSKMTSPLSTFHTLFVYLHRTTHTHVSFAIVQRTHSHCTTHKVGQIKKKN